MRKVIETLALSGLIIAPVSAQQTSDSAKLSSTAAAAFFNAREIVPGVVMTQGEYESLRDNGCVVGPSVTIAPLLAKMEKKAIVPCSKKFNAGLDNFAKEGATIWSAVRVPDGVEVCTTIKGLNLSNNRSSCRNYSMSVLTDGKARFADSNWSASGDMVVAQALSAIPAALVAGPMTAATGQLLAPKCKNCGGTQVVSYNQNVSGSSSQSASTLSAALAGSNCPTGVCGGSGHTQNGPGSAPAP